MEYSMNAVANKMILVIVCLSVLIAAGSYFIFASLAGNESVTVLATIMGLRTASQVSDTIPFAAGVAFAMGLNIAKVLLIKRAVNNALTRDEFAAKMYLKAQYLLRLVLTGAVLLAAGLLHINAFSSLENPQSVNPVYVNLMGTFFGIFTFPVSTYLMRFFFRNALNETPEFLAATPENTMQDAIDKLNSIGENDDLTTLGEADEE